MEQKLKGSGLKLPRKGEIGDWENNLTPEMGARLDGIMEQKLKGSGLKLPRKKVVGNKRREETRKPGKRQCMGRAKTDISARSSVHAPPCSACSQPLSSPSSHYPHLLTFHRASIPCQMLPPNLSYRCLNLLLLQTKKADNRVLGNVSHWRLELGHTKRMIWNVGKGKGKEKKRKSEQGKSDYKAGLQPVPRCATTSYKKKRPGRKKAVQSWHFWNTFDHALHDSITLFTSTYE
uniref:C2H2-type domain-containing protein n=1 Tax=Salix viminalis TaxID=40686 RepID=A0A6N2KG44_SALVM